MFFRYIYRVWPLEWKLISLKTFYYIYNFYRLWPAYAKPTYAAAVLPLHALFPSFFERKKILILAFKSIRLPSFQYLTPLSDKFHKSPSKTAGSTTYRFSTLTWINSSDLVIFYVLIKARKVVRVKLFDLVHLQVCIFFLVRSVRYQFEECMSASRVHSVNNMGSDSTGFNTRAPSFHSAYKWLF